MLQATPYLYRVHGLTVGSQIEFAWFTPATSAPEVQIRRGAVPDHLESPSSSGVLFEAAPASYLLRVPGIAKYWVRDGQEVLIEAESGVSAADISAFIAGPVLTALLQQRGTLVLHAASVAGRAGAVLLAGHSGNGKSTLLAALAQRGFGVLSDDAAAITLDADQRPIVHPGIPHARLWKDAAERLGHDSAAMERARDGIEKFLLSLEQQFVVESQALARIYVLGIGSQDTVTVERVADRECFEVLRAQTRNLRVLEGLRMHASHFRIATTVAARIPIFRVVRPRGTDSLGELADLLEAELR